jgi:hypothetical protein
MIAPVQRLAALTMPQALKERAQTLGDALALREKDRGLSRRTAVAVYQLIAKDVKFKALTDFTQYGTGDFRIHALNLRCGIRRGPAPALPLTRGPAAATPKRFWRCDGSREFGPALNNATPRPR